MAEYIPSPSSWVRDQVELYESSGGTQGTTLRDTGLPVIIVTAFSSEASAIEAANLGVAGYLTAPFTTARVLSATARALGE